MRLSTRLKDPVHIARWSLPTPGRYRSGGFVDRFGANARLSIAASAAHRRGAGDSCPSGPARDCQTGAL